MVFISYRHEDEAHKQRVLEFAQRLAAAGVEVQMDQLQKLKCPEGENWPVWSTRQVKDADAILIVASSGWFRRFDSSEDNDKALATSGDVGDGPQRGLGAAAEAQVIRQQLYDAGFHSRIHRIVRLSTSGEVNVPLEIKGFHQFDGESLGDFNDIVRWLRGAPPAPGSLPPAVPSTMPAARPARFWWLWAATGIVVLGLIGYAISGWPAPREEYAAESHSRASEPQPDPLTLLKRATREQPYVNRYGMKFIPLPGTRIALSVYETTVAEFRAYVEASGAGIEAVGEDEEAVSWLDPGFPQVDQHPVTVVSQVDAVAFCGFLSGREGLSYRLPTDREWSVAVGIGGQEDADADPSQLDRGLSVYPWDGAYPPKEPVGNYGEAEEPADGMKYTAPAGSFPPTRLGFYDLGGNVWEWTSSSYSRLRQQDLVLRGASWQNFGGAALRSSARRAERGTARDPTFGFRCAIEIPAGHSGR